MTKGLRAIIIGFIISLSYMTAANAQEVTSLTVLTPWTKDANVNGALEAQRRDWLAKVRKMKQMNKKNVILLASNTA